MRKWTPVQQSSPSVFYENRENVIRLLFEEQIASNKHFFPNTRLLTSVLVTRAPWTRSQWSFCVQTSGHVSLDVGWSLFDLMHRTVTQKSLLGCLQASGRTFERTIHVSSDIRDTESEWSVFKSSIRENCKKPWPESCGHNLPSTPPLVTLLEMLFWSGVMKEGLKWAKVSVYQSVYIPVLNYGRKMWIMSLRTTEVQAVEITFHLCFLTAILQRVKWRLKRCQMT